MPLNSDSQGFLIGNKVALSGFGSEMDGLKNDVRSIRKSLMGRGGRDAVVTPNRGSFATPNRRGSSSRDIVEPTARSGHSVSATVRRVSGAATGAVGGVVNTESDASVKALSEIAMPLKRGWAALRGGGTGERQEGWLKRIFGALRGSKNDGLTEGGTHFERSRGHSAAASNWAASGGSPGSVRARDGSVGWDAGAGTGKEVSLRAIERHLKSIDRKTSEPKGFSLLGAMMSVIRALPAMYGIIQEFRMDSNLRKIEKHANLHNRHAFPFYAYARKRLKEMGELEEAPEHKGRGFLAFLFAPLLALLGGLIAKLSGLPLIGPILGRLAKMLGIPLGAGAAARAATGVGAGGGKAARTPTVWGKTQDGIRGNRAARTGRVVARNAGRVLKRVPVIGSLIALGLGIAGSSSIEKDASLTRDQKNAAEGKNWGGVAGGLGGAAAGAALGTVLLPGIGTVVGAVLGAVLGDWLGGNLGEMLGEKFSTYMAPISAGFAEIKLWALATWGWVRDGATKFYDGASAVFTGIGDHIGEKWEALTDLGKSVFDRFATAITAIYEGLKSSKIFGPLIRAAEQTAAAAKEKGAQAVDGAIEGAKAGAGAAVDTVKATVEALTPNGIKERRDALALGEHKGLGRVAAMYESGRGGVATISTGKGDHGGASYGKHQLSSNAGTLQNYLKQSGYGAQFAGLSPGSSEFNAKWRDLANNDSKFGDSQREYIKATHYDPQMAKLAKAGIDLSGRGEAVHEAVYSTSVQLGGNTGAIQRALGGRGVAGLSDAQIVAAIQDYKIANNESLFKSSSANTRAGTLKRAHQEKATLLGMAAEESKVPSAATPSFAGVSARVDSSYLAAATAPIVAPVIATTKTPAPPPPPPPPPVIADAPQVQTPLGSGDSGKPITVQVAGADAGQDVRDRTLAHIVTGGYAGAA